MEIFLVRHTTPAIEKGICYGQTDLDLAHTFEDEAIEVLKKLPKQLDVVYSSPLKRCTTLAHKISDNITLDDRLKELDFGSWEMQKWDAIPLFEIQPWYDNFVNTSTLNGESYQDLQHRVLDFYKGLKKQKLSSVAIITHSGVIRSLLAYINNIILKDSFEELKISYGEVFSIKTINNN